MSNKNAGNEYELRTAIKVNRWLAGLGLDRTVAVMTLGRGNHSDIAVVRTGDSIPFPDFRNPFCSPQIGGFDEREVQSSLNLAAVNLDSAVAYIEVKLGEGVQMGTPRCNFIDGRWGFNRPPRVSGGGASLLARLNSEDCLAQTRAFVSSLGVSGNDLVCYSNRNHGLSAVSYTDLSASGSSQGRMKYIVRTRDEDPQDMAGIVSDYYLNVKGGRTDYIQIRGLGLYRLSGEDPLGMADLGSAGFLESVRGDCKRTSFGMRYILRSRGVYEIIPELKFRRGTFTKSGFDFDKNA